MLVHIRMGTNMAAGNQQEHLSLSFTTKVCIHSSRNKKIFKGAQSRLNGLKSLA